MSEKRTGNISLSSEQCPEVFQRQLKPDMLIRHVNNHLPGAIDRLIEYYQMHIYVAVLSFMRIKGRAIPVCDAIQSRIRTEFHSRNNEEFLTFLSEIIRSESYEAMAEYAFGLRAKKPLS